jgi:hypothetical protein
MAPMIAAIAARIAPPATPFSATNSICPLLVEFLLPEALAPAEQLGHEVPVAVFVPAGTGAEAYCQFIRMEVGTPDPASWLVGPLYPRG